MRDSESVKERERERERGREVQQRGTEGGWEQMEGDREKGRKRRKLNGEKRRDTEKKE